MAELAKKLHIKNTEGVTQSASIYSTTTESQTPYLSLVVDGAKAYASLVDPSNDNATSCRVKKADGTILAVGKAGVAPYDYALITTAGEGSFTVPAGVTKLRVTCVGGGAGACYCDYLSDTGTKYSDKTLFVAGGNTSFLTVTANGASDAIINLYYISDGSKRYYCKGYTVSTGSNPGAVSSNTVAGGAALPLILLNGTTVHSAGAGGQVVKIRNGTRLCSGSSGYKTTSFCDVSPGQVISYSVGDGGRSCFFQAKKSSATYSSGITGEGSYPGNPGAILIEWGEGIQ